MPWLAAILAERRSVAREELLAQGAKSKSAEIIEVCLSDAVAQDSFLTYAPEIKTAKFRLLKEIAIAGLWLSGKTNWSRGVLGSARSLPGRRRGCWAA